MNKTLIAIALVLIVSAGGFFIYSKTSKEPSSNVETQSPPGTTSEAAPNVESDFFANPKKSAHYESNTPEHSAILAGVPINVVINFNFDLTKGSEVSIIKDEKEYGVEKTVIDEEKLAMRRKMDPASPDGLYTVNYKACWADGSCHDGSFQFKIDRSKAGEFKDLRNQNQVTIDLKNFQFNPSKVRVSKGTKITWINQDSVVHTVNTDSHPAHTYYLKQNSRDLNQGDKYEIMFDSAGIYLYHCTPHADTMKGQILVD